MTPSGLAPGLLATLFVLTSLRPINVQAQPPIAKAWVMDNQLPATENLRRAIARGDVQTALAHLPGANLHEPNGLGSKLLHEAANFSGDLSLLRHC